MRTRRGSVVVAVPADRAWELCAAIERLPEFVAAIESCDRIDELHHRWTGRAFGVRRTWLSEWVERTPGGRIAWRTDDPMVPDGEVEVRRLDECRSRVTIVMRYEPRTLVDAILVNRITTRLRLAWDLRSFRRWAEAQRTGAETAAD